jgi:hypothetical protein
MSQTRDCPVGCDADEQRCVARSICGGDGSEPWFEEDFSSYSSTSDFINNINGWWGSWEDGSRSSTRATIENDNIPGIGNVNVYQQAQPNTCDGGRVGRDLHLPSPEEEIWVEIYVKFSPNYKTDFTSVC